MSLSGCGRFTGYRPTAVERSKLSFIAFASRLTEGRSRYTHKCENQHPMAESKATLHLHLTAAVASGSEWIFKDSLGQVGAVKSRLSSAVGCYAVPAQMPIASS